MSPLGRYMFPAMSDLEFMLLLGLSGWAQKHHFGYLLAVVGALKFGFGALFATFWAIFLNHSFH